MIDADTFRSVLGRFASGITILTARDSTGKDHGMTASAFCSLSLDPSLVLFCVDRTASMHDFLLTKPAIGVSVLSAEQETHSRRFAADEDDRFDGIAFTRGETGVALLEAALAHMECRVLRHHDGGDHTIFIAEIDWAAAHATKGRPLLYYRGGYAQLVR